MITYIITGLMYIGQTSNTLEHRWNQHKKDAKYAKPGKHTGCRYLRAAMKKHGADKFEIKQIDSAEDQNDLDALEVKYIALYNTLAPSGYNLTTGGKSGWKASEETKKYIGEQTRKGIEANIDNLRTNELSKGLPMHCIYTVLKGGKPAFMIQHHPLCNQKEFKISEYASIDLARQAMLDFLNKIVTANEKFVIPKNGGNKVPRGIMTIKGGYQIKKMFSSKRYVVDFKDPNKTDDENLLDAKNHLEKLIDTHKIKKCSSTTK